MLIPQVYYERQACRFLDIGDLAFLTHEAKALTNLGSCVSVCLFSSQLRMSSVCHAQMPERKRKSNKCYDNCPDSCTRGQSCEMDNKYVDSVLPFMIHSFDRKSIPRVMMHAIVVGGSSMLPSLRSPSSVGILNAEMTLGILATNKIQVVHTDIGGITSRRLEVQNDTGYVYVNKKLVYKMWDRTTNHSLGKE